MSVKPKYHEIPVRFVPLTEKNEKMIVKVNEKGGYSLNDFNKENVVFKILDPDTFTGVPIMVFYKIKDQNYIMKFESSDILFSSVKGVEDDLKENPKTKVIDHVGFKISFMLHDDLEKKSNEELVLIKIISDIQEMFYKFALDKVNKKAVGLEDDDEMRDLLKKFKPFFKRKKSDKEQNKNDESVGQKYFNCKLWSTTNPKVKDFKGNLESKLPVERHHFYTSTSDAKEVRTIKPVKDYMGRKGRYYVYFSINRIYKSSLGISCATTLSKLIWQDDKVKMNNESDKKLDDLQNKFQKMELESIKDIPDEGTLPEQ